MIKRLSLIPLLITSLLCNAESREEQITSVLDSIKNNRIEYVIFMFTDLLGKQREVMIPTEHVKDALKNNVMFDGSSIPGCTAITKSDMALKADCSTFTVLPWTKGSTKTARILCDIYESETKPYAGDPRFILQKVLNEAREMGYECLAGPEIEFFMFKQQEDNKLKPFDSKEYFAAEENINMQAYNGVLLGSMRDQGINIVKIHHEVAPGQLEVVIRYDNALAVADQIVATRHTIKSVALNSGLKATFMPKPIFGQNGSGMHIHFSLYDINNKCNAFADLENEANLSEIGRHFIAGVLHYIQETTALFNSSINSYKRLVPGYEAPTNICHGTKNRSALVRIPQIPEGHTSAVRAELRSPDSSGNPYLALAALFKAGLEGIKNKMELAPMVEDNLYHVSQEELVNRGILSLPASLGEALQKLSSSELAQELLGDQGMSEFVKLKNKEVHAAQTMVTEWEIEQYL
jgi:glutamine synthetase